MLFRFVWKILVTPNYFVIQTVMMERRMVDIYLLPTIEIAGVLVLAFTLKGQ